MTTGNTQTESMVSGYRIQPRTTVAPDAPCILIAEEQAAVRELLCWILHLAGYRTRVYAGGETVLSGREQALKPEDNPEVLLLDLSLLSAAEAAQYVGRVRSSWQENCALLPHLIILTTQPQVQAALGARGECVLLKPFHVHDLLSLIQQALLRKNAHFRPVLSQVIEPAPAHPARKK